MNFVNLARYFVPLSSASNSKPSTSESEKRYGPYGPINQEALVKKKLHCWYTL
jgi:hypothetical protein